MSQVPANATKKPLSGAWMSWLAIAAVAIAMGLIAPQLMQSEAAPEKTEAKSDTKAKGNLDYAAPSLPEAPSIQGMFVRLGAGTAVVLGLCVATLFGVKRWLYPVAANGSMPRELLLMETLHLGNRCSLHLVHLNKQPILIGVDGGGIKTVVPLTAPFEEALAQVETRAVEEEPIVFPKLAA